MGALRKELLGRRRNRHFCFGADVLSMFCKYSSGTIDGIV